MRYAPLIVSGIGVIVFIVTLVLIFAVIPPIIEDKIVEKIALEEGTDQFDRFLVIPQPLFYKVYFFHLLNEKEVHNGAIPMVKEMGPYVYKLHSKKKDVTIEENGEKIKFRNDLLIEFDAAATAPLTEDDELLVLNVAMNAALQEMEASELGLIDELPGEVFNSPNSMFIKTTPKEYLFEGARFCIESHLACPIILEKGTKTIRKLKDGSLAFSFFNHKNTSDDGLWTIYSGKKDILQIGQITNLDGKSSLDIWEDGEDSVCNSINGTDSTIAYPFRHGKESEEMWMFNSDICRRVSLHFKEKRDYKGIPTFRYEANDAFIVKPPSCFCVKKSTGITDENGCLYSGALDLYNCQKGAVVLTHPHFMDADKIYQDTVHGLRYDAPKEEFVTYMESDPYTGTPVKGSKRAQFNMFLRPVKGVKLTNNLRKTLMPIIWVDEGIALNQKNIDLLNESLFNNLLIVDAVTWTVVGVAATLAIAGLLYYYCKSKSTEV